MVSFSADAFKKYYLFIVSEIEEGFVHVQLNSPKNLNAFSEKTWRNYNEIITELDKCEETNVILISSNVPKAFSSGLDLKEAMSLGVADQNLTPQERQKKLKKHIIDFQYCIGAPARIDTPTICLLNGINYGLALDIAACCSIRVATSDCRFSIREIKIGIAADIGSLQRLPKLINNKSLLYQYALTGCIFGSEDALKLGFISNVVSDLNLGLDYCKKLGLDINGNTQWAIKGTKKCIQDILDGTTTEQGLAYIAEYNSIHIGGGFLDSMGKVKL